MKILKIALRPLVCAWIGYCIHDCMTQGRPTAALICLLILVFYSVWVTIADLAIEKLADEARKEIADFKKQYANDIE